MFRKEESPYSQPKSEKKRKNRNYRKEKHKEEEFSDISDEEGGGRPKAVSKYASVASSFIEAVESATIKGLLFSRTIKNQNVSFIASRLTINFV